MSFTQGRHARGTTTEIHLARLKRIQGQRSAQIRQDHLDPIWDEHIPLPPDWDTLSDREQHLYKLAAIAYAVRAVADTHGVSAARLLSDREVL